MSGIEVKLFTYLIGGYRKSRSLQRSLVMVLFICLMVLPAGAQVSALRTVAYPWAGGLNSCQFCAIDFDLDGKNDLLVFDRHGNRALTFRNGGSPDSLDYEFIPRFSGKLPEMHDWVITADYDCDGKMDLFTYGNGGVRVFQNISDTSLKFRMVTDLLESYYYTGKVGILVTDVDYPAFTDINGDGDLDMLTFFGLGSYVEYHENQSMEKYGNCDSLDFKLIDHCWGKFRESEGGNRITLNSPCSFDTGWRMKKPAPLHQERGPGGEASPSSRHTGSTLLATDLNGDGTKDLIVGDVDFPGLSALTNGGTADSAYMTSADTLFPMYDRPLRLFSFPAVSLIDLDNDGLDDLVVSPFDPSLSAADNYNCAWFYKNTGTASVPHFEFRSDRLFRDEMMDFGSASHPVLYDLDGDGLQDLLVGTDGYYDSSYYKDAVLHSVYHARIAFFRNSGTIASPVFTWVTDDLAGIGSLRLRGIYPAAGDLNGDGITDLLAGRADGTLVFFAGTGYSGGIPEFDEPVFNYRQIDSCEYSAPQILDLDKDGNPDIILGRQDGTLAWYRNTGPPADPSFERVSNKLGNIDVTNHAISYKGFSTPCFFRLPGGETCLLVGSDEGRIHLYSGIDQNLTGSFTEQDTLFTWLSADPSDTLFGWQTSPAIGKLSGPGTFDLITGNYSGGLNYITKHTPATIIPGVVQQEYGEAPGLLIYPNPSDRETTIRARDPRCTMKGLRFPKATMPDSGSRLLVQDLYGRPLMNIPFDGEVVLRTGSLPAGIYFVRCGSAVARLVVCKP